MSTTFYWAGGSGSFGSAVSWLIPDPMNPGHYIHPKTAPGPTDVADVDQNGSLYGAGYAYYFNISATISISGTTNVGSFTAIGYDGASAVTVSASWHNTSDMAIGDGSDGSLRVGSGASLRNDGEITIGNEGDETGTLIIAQGGTVTNGGPFVTVGNQAGSNGVVSITGIGSSWSISGQLTIGYYGSGMVSIAAGGHLSDNGPYDALGSQAGSSGTVAIDGAGSLWTTASQIVVGAGGAGSLTVSNTGSVTATNALDVIAAPGGSGELSINSGGQITSGGSYTTIGAFADAPRGEGDATVDGSGSKWTIGGQLSVGGSGTGNLTVQNLGSVGVATGFIVGDQAGSEGTLDISSGGNFTAAGTYAAVGQNAMTTGEVTVDGTKSSLTTGGYIQVGVAGAGTLTASDGARLAATNEIGVAVGSGGLGQFTIEDGATATSGGSFDAIAGGTDAKGTVTVEGMGSSWTLAAALSVGQQGGGTLDINDDGRVQSGELTVGDQLGSSGTVEITNGGALINNGQYDEVADGLAETGTVLVAGDGSSWTMPGQLTVGYHGSGTVDVEAKGQLSSGGPYDAIGSQVMGFGTVTVEGMGSQWASKGQIQVGTAGSGTLTVSDAATVAATNEIDVAASMGGIGDFDVDTGGAATSGGSFDTIAGGVNAQGTATVEGVGSKWTLAATLSVGEQGDGTLNVDDGGSVQSGGLTVGNKAGSTGEVDITHGGALTSSGQYNTVASGLNETGTVLVSGDGSSWTMPGQLTIGYDGKGTVEVKAKGQLSSGGPYDALGSQVYGSGIVTVDGTGSLWTAAGQIAVGDSGSGTLTITNEGLVVSKKGINVGVSAGSTGVLSVATGGSVTSEGLYTTIGILSGSQGTVTVDGDGSSFDSKGQLTVGQAGRGTLTVTDAGLVSSGGPYDQVGSGASGNGLVTVTGPDSTWDAAGAIDVGVGGTGKLEIDDHGTVDAASVYVGGTFQQTGDGGEIELSAGTLDTGLVTLGIGAMLSGFGTITGAVVNEGVIFLNSGTLDVPDGVTGSGVIVIGPDGALDNKGTVTTGGPSGGVGSTGDFYLWVGPISGSWASAANWKDLTTGLTPAGPPGAQDSATFDSPTTAAQVIAGTGAAAALTLNGDSDVTGQIVAGTLTAGAAAQGLTTFAVSSGAGVTAGTATLTDETATVNGAFRVTGTLTLSGVVQSDYSEPSLGAAGGGTIQAGSLVVDTAGLSVDSKSSIEVGTVGGAALGALTVDAGATLSVLPGANEFGGVALLTGGNIVDDGTISVAAQVDAGYLLDGVVVGTPPPTLSGTGQLVVQDGAEEYVEGALAGSVAVRLGRGALLGVSQASAGAEIDLAGGQDALFVQGYTYDPATAAFVLDYDTKSPITGFDASDSLTVESKVTSAVYVPGATAGTGSLVLSNGATQVGTLTLQGDYTGEPFLAVSAGTDPEVEARTAIVLGSARADTPASAGTPTGQRFTWIGTTNGDWNTAANWQDTTTGTVAAVAPGARDDVTFGGPSWLAEVIGGNGDSASLTLGGGQVFTGHVTTGALTVAAAAGLPYLDIDAGGSLTAASMSVADNASVHVTGGSLMVAGALTFAGDEGGIAAGDGARVQVGSISFAGVGEDVGASSSIEVGSAGDAALGTFTIDEGATVSIDSTVESNVFTVSGKIVDDGVITIQSQPSYYLLLSEAGLGDDPAPLGLTGSGLLDIEAGSYCDTTQVSVTGSLTLQMDAGANLTVAAVGAGDRVQMKGGADTLSLTAPSGFAASISGFDPTDTFAVGVAADSVSYAADAPGTGTLTISDAGAPVDSITIDGDYAGDTFLVAADGAGMSQVNVVDAVVADSGGVLTVTAQAGATVSLNAILADAEYARATTAVLNGSGTVTATAALSIPDLELEAGTLVLSGVTITTDPILVDAGAAIGGSGTLIGAVTDDGGITAQGGALELTGAVAGSGTLGIGGDATLRLDAAVGAGLAIDFRPNGGETLNLGAPLSAKSTIEGFAIADAITFAGSYGSVARSFSGDVMTVTGDGAAIATLTFAPGYDDANTSVSDSAGVVTVETTSPACFAAGTRIDTLRGEVAVEALAVGDFVVTLSGAPQPVRWIGRRRIDLRRHPAPEEAWPIRIAAGALADGVPRRDLLVSPDHAMLVDGALLPARLLLNSRSVTQATGLAAVTYFHLELDTHDILLAEGAPAESYLDTGNRSVFENASVIDLHPRLCGDRGAASGACLPLTTEPERVQPVWARVAARAGVEPPADDPAAAACNAGLVLEVGGRVLRPVTTAGGHVVFVLPPAASAARLLSHAGRPSDFRPWLDDRRRLGVQVRRIMADETALALDGPALGGGWWPPERGELGTMWRWTDGTAEISVPAGTQVLTLHVIGVGPIIRVTNGTSLIDSKSSPRFNRSSKTRAGAKAAAEPSTSFG